MKAIVRHTYGPPDVLQLKEIEQPIPKDNEILVKVYAATVNRTDCGILWGAPWIIRFFTGLFQPNRPVTGTDFAGRVEATGKHVKAFKAGDRVWGFDDNGLSSHAQYLTVSAEKALAAIPDNITYEQAAAAPEGAHYAYNFIKRADIGPGKKVLVNGATGAIGSAAVQLLKHFDSYVTAVGNTKNLELMQSLGADKVIDYTREDFTNDDETYDCVFDAVGKSTFAACKPLLNPGGIYISSELGPGVQNPFLALVTPLTGGKKVKFPIPLDTKGSLRLIGQLLEQGKFKPVIDRRYPLEETPEAFRYVASGQKTGNVVINVSSG